ncbi:hypothetical protein CBR_g37644 [Chara braunii]|uniref:RIIa domain-containing protein n=2 Tax=Chara braunii TaxID=69332 RepID=A0A388LNN1_CHABU|nr:hypothetical protein CBR_g37644 [Chara braunii]|eukprot:GBG83845.1 hypothetical protein CBR_g37644 [Chara braunii]
MDIEPIYCVEQIRIPPDLADILKAYAKEVIRNEPANILEFSAHYFAQLASVTEVALAFLPPTLEQVRNVWTQMQNTEMITKDDMAAVCTSHDIQIGVLEKVMRLGNFLTDLVDPKEVLCLLLTTVGDSLMSVLDTFFKVFGDEAQKMSVELFLKLFGFLAIRDTDISPNFLERLAADLALKGLMEITYDDISDNEFMKELMEKMESQNPQ